MESFFFLLEINQSGGSHNPSTFHERRPCPSSSEMANSLSSLSWVWLSPTLWIKAFTVSDDMREKTVLWSGQIRRAPRTLSQLNGLSVAVLGRRCSRPPPTLWPVKSREVLHSVGLEILDKTKVPKDRDILSYYRQLLESSTVGSGPAEGHFIPVQTCCTVPLPIPAWHPGYSLESLQRSC